MKNAKKNTKKTSRNTGIVMTSFFLGVAFVVLIGWSSKHFDSKPINDVVVEILNQNETRFLSSQKVKDFILEELNQPLAHIQVNELNLENLQAVLNTNPYVEESSLFIDRNRKLHVEVKQKFPIIRIKGETTDYYLSNKGEKIPQSLDFTSRVMVASGYILDNGKNDGKINTQIVNDLFELAQHVYKDDVLYALIEQIYVTDDQQIEVITKLSDHEFVLGTISDLDVKMRNMKIFYKEITKVEGWDTHKKVNLSWTNQIVGVKR